MYTDEVRTPQTLNRKYYSTLHELKCRVTASGRRSICSSNSPATASSATPTNGAKLSKSKSSPQMGANVCTPPPKRLQRVQNPFEAALTDRLHLPLIASPSLFQCRSRTPQLSSTQFEWDIEEVSQLKPADVEPHETQFHDSPDPEQESKAQLAISTFFKESHIVPSPVDCPLRKHRIIINESDENTPISNKSKLRHRDCETQTELTLPPVLPKALEDALRPYFQPHLAGPRIIHASARKSTDFFNSSMRRKLFDLQNIIVLGEAEPQQPADDSHAQMVGSSPQGKQTMFAGRLSDSGGEGSSSFGCLSPIRNLCGLPPGTPDDGNGAYSARKRKQLLRELVDLPSPIAPSEHLSRRSQKSTSNSNEHVTLSELTGTGREADKFTPDRSSSPMTLEYSTDCSINQRVSRLRVNSCQQPNQSLIQEVELALVASHGTDDDEAEGETEIDCETDTEGEVEEEEEEDGMQLSQMSTNSFNYSSSNSDTPRGHRRRRSANRKNLSQSFSANIQMSNEEQSEDHSSDEQDQAAAPPGINVEPSAAPQQRVGFYRTDSGFNETSSTSHLAFSQELPSGSNYECTSLDASMVCCSTPSTRS